MFPFCHYPGCKLAVFLSLKTHQGRQRLVFWIWIVPSNWHYLLNYFAVLTCWLKCVLTSCTKCDTRTAAQRSQSSPLLQRLPLSCWWQPIFWIAEEIFALRNQGTCKTNLILYVSALLLRMMSLEYLFRTIKATWAVGGSQFAELQKNLLIYKLSTL